jgi:hypothetical protein
MPPPQHNRNQDQLRANVHPTRETIRLVRQARANPHTAIRRRDFEDNIKHSIRDRVAVEIRHLDTGDEQHGEHQPPQIMRELPTDLLPDELRARALGASGCAWKWIAESGGDAFAQRGHDGGEARGSLDVVGVGYGVLSVDTERTLFVDVGVAHGYHDGVHGNVHHDYVEHLQPDAEAGNRNYVEAAGAYRDGLEEAVQDAEAGGDCFDGFVAYV